MVYITGHTFTNQPSNPVIAKVYANCDSVELKLNGASLGAHTSTNCIFTWPLMLAPGRNDVQAIGAKGRDKVTDSLVWIAPAIPTVTEDGKPGPRQGDHAGAEPVSDVGDSRSGPRH
jgi:hypothetical protein